MADDTISRNAALKACYNGWNKDYREIAQDIKDLPPAQPETHEERTETHACDLIDRQAAIDAIKGEIEINGYSHVVDVLKQLPSVQPEIVRCKDCIKQPLCKFSQYQGNDGYCSLAERKTDE